MPWNALFRSLIWLPLPSKEKFIKSLRKLFETIASNWGDHIDQYFDAILKPNERVQPRRIIMFSVLLYNCSIQVMLTLFAPLSDWTRLLLHDPTLFYGICARFNWIHALIAFNTICINYRMYHPHSSALIQLLKQVHNNDSVHFFVQQRVPFKGKWQFVARVIRYKTQFWATIVPQFFFMGIVLNLVFIFESYFYFTGEHYARAFESGMIGYFGFVLSAISTLSFIVVLHSFIRIHLIFGHTVVMSTLIFFTKLKQVNCLLTKPSMQLTTLSLHQFIVHHTRTLSMIFEYNRFFGQLLLVLIAFNFPQSTFMSTGVAMHRFPPFATVVFVDYSAGQFIFIIVFHLLAAMYTQLIHRGPKRLFRYQMCPLPLQNRLRLSLYIDKFNTYKKYGITYGPLGLLCFLSFAKFLLAYGEFLLYWVQIIRK